MESYITIKGETSAQIVEKRSRFIAYIKKVETVEEAFSFVSLIKTRNHDARHNVFAFRLTDGLKRYSDDGEPQGTAGIPILDIIEKEDIFNICIVVTRYFGGILLGTGGLVHAYSLAAKTALENIDKVMMIKCSVLELFCSYTQYGKIPSIISDYEGKIDDVGFSDDVRVIFHIPNNNLPGFKKELTEFSKGALEFEKKSESFFEK